MKKSYIKYKIHINKCPKLIKNKNTQLTQTITNAIICADEKINKPSIIEANHFGLNSTFKLIFRGIFKPNTIPITPETPIKFLNMILSFVFQILYYICFAVGIIIVLQLINKVSSCDLNIKLLFHYTDIYVAIVCILCFIFGRIFWLISKTFDQYEYPASYVLGYTAVAVAVIALIVEVCNKNPLITS